ncbi:ACP S-malonyltransferase [Clostridium sp. 19966]|uniref:ACP S-malonyltransferase n=1 Tax=Clostridium sp. 19966 TaxID=2768166 RepID=UPI0028DF4ECF|nr:ACP S-malonyltransferase [Clostridium sp. 19966]MDT8716259.1 ACP S-malonyltransferase [Clostridium sp. 19966]
MSKIGFIFSGQGSQYVGMGKELYDNFIEFKEIFDKANDSLGYDLKGICFHGPKEILDITENTQPAVLTMSCAILNILTAKGIIPDATAGFSLGEYSALVCSKALSFEKAVKLVGKRGKFMQEAVPVGIGAMAAVLGLDREKVLQCCSEASSEGVVEAVNFNCPGQIVLAGEIKAIDKAMELAIAKGGKSVKLNVSAPFHSSLLKPAADKLGIELGNIEFNDIEIPVLTNVNADYINNKNEIKSLLIKQAMSPVYWEDIINRMINDGIDTFLEIGPGKTLSGFVKRINRKLDIMNVENIESLNQVLAKISK